MSARGKARAKAGIIAKMERRIHDLETKCSSLACENHRLKKELKLYRESMTGKEMKVENAVQDIDKIAKALRLVGGSPYTMDIWPHEVFRRAPEDEHTGDVQQSK